MCVNCNVNDVQSYFRTLKAELADPDCNWAVTKPKMLDELDEIKQLVTDCYKLTEQLPDKK